MWGIILILLGLISFLTGYFFLGKVQGQNDCKEKPESTEINYKGGVAGVFLGILFVIIGFVIQMMTTRPTEYSDGSN
jgi:uncharacterized membrane protein